MPLPKSRAPTALAAARQPAPDPRPNEPSPTCLRAPARVPPFASAEAAWFWTAASLRARQDPGALPPGAGPCRPDEVVKCLDALYRNRRVELLHVRILRLWGWRGVAPNPAWARERCDWRLWREALDRLDGKLRVLGLVAGNAPGEADTDPRSASGGPPAMQFPPQ